MNVKLTFKLVLKGVSFLILGILSMLFFAACNGKTDIREYYYPIKNLQTPKVYEYRSVTDSLPPYYRYFRTVVTGEQVFFTENFYDHQFDTRQFAREERVREGMLLRELFLYMPDNQGKTQVVKAAIKVGANFPFEVTDSNGVFVYNITFTNPRDSSRNNIVRNRRFIRKTYFEFKNSKYEAIEFEVKELLENELKGTWKHEFKITEIYAKHLGLVLSKRDLGNGHTLTYQLHDIYNMEDLESKFQRQIEPK
jgi:hypothetical protein